MRKKSKRLQPVVDFTEKKETDAAKALSLASSEVQNNRQRLKEFEKYRDEYGQQFSAVAEVGLSASRVKDYQSFFSKLNHVLDQQKAAIKTAEIEYEKKKRQWLTARNKLKAINKVQEKHVLKEEVIEEKQQQKELDDRGVRKLID